MDFCIEIWVQPNWICNKDLQNQSFFLYFENSVEIFFKLKPSSDKTVSNNSIHLKVLSAKRQYTNMSVHGCEIFNKYFLKLSHSLLSLCTSSFTIEMFAYSSLQMFCNQMCCVESVAKLLATLSRAVISKKYWNNLKYGWKLPIEIKFPTFLYSYCR